MSKLVLVLALEALDAATTIELSTEDLICLNETLKLAGEVSILSLEALSMLLQSLSLGKKVTIVSAALRLGHAEAFNIASQREKHVFLLLEAELRVTDLDGDIGVAAFLEVNLFSKVIVLTSHTLIVSTESGVLGRDAGVLLTDASKFSLSVLKSELLVPEVSAAAVKKLLGILDAGLRARELEVERLELVGLVGSLSGSLFVHLLQASKFTPHLSTLNFDALNLTLEVLELGTLVVVLVTLGDGLLAQAASLEVLLIEEALGAGKLVVKIKVLLSPTQL